MDYPEQMVYFRYSLDHINRFIKCWFSYIPVDHYNMYFLFPRLLQWHWRNSTTVTLSTKKIRTIWCMIFQKYALGELQLVYFPQCTTSSLWWTPFQNDADGFCSVVFCCDVLLCIWSISFRFISQARVQTCDCPSDNETTLKYRGS